MKMKSMMRAAALVLAGPVALAAAQAQGVALSTFSNSAGTNPACGGALSCAFSFGGDFGTTTNAPSTWATSRSVTFSQNGQSVTPSSYFVRGISGASVGNGALGQVVAPGGLSAFTDVAPIGLPSSFSGLTSIWTSSYGAAVGTGTNTLDGVGYEAESRVRIAGSLAAGQSVSLTSSTTVVGLLQTTASSAFAAGTTVRSGLFADWDGRSATDNGPFNATSTPILLAGALPGSFTTAVTYSVSRQTSAGLELLKSFSTTVGSLPIDQSFEFKVGDRLVLSITSTLTVNLNGGASGTALNLDLALTPMLQVAGPVVAVPEPGTFVLAGLGLVLVGVARRRRARV